MQPAENDSDHNENQDSPEQENNFKTTDELVNAVEESVKNVKNDRKIMLHRNLTPIDEGAKESVMSTQHDIIMEETVVTYYEHINQLLTEYGYQPIELIIYPQFCKMLSIEQLKESFTKILKDKSLLKSENDELLQRIKQLEEDNALMSNTISKPNIELEAYYTKQIDTLNEDLQKYKMAELERELESNKRAEKVESVEIKIKELEKELEQKAQIIDLILSEKNELLNQLKKLKKSTDDSDFYKIEYDQLNTQVVQLLKSNSQLQNENLQLTSSVKVKTLQGITQIRSAMFQ